MELFRHDLAGSRETASTGCLSIECSRCEARTFSNAGFRCRGNDARISTSDWNCSQVPSVRLRETSSQETSGRLMMRRRSCGRMYWSTLNKLLFRSLQVQRKLTHNARSTKLWPRCRPRFGCGSGATTAEHARFSGTAPRRVLTGIGWIGDKPGWHPSSPNRSVRACASYTTKTARRSPQYSNPSSRSRASTPP